MATSQLRLDPVELAACVSCGLCLPTCPTYRVSGSEAESPRGRITLMRLIESGASPLTAGAATFFDSCVQCRACDVACPSGVQFGHLIEATKTSLQLEMPRRLPIVRRLGLRSGLWLLGHHRLLRGAAIGLVVAQRLRMVPRSVALPRVRISEIRLPLAITPTAAQGEPVWLFTGCVMDAWQRSIHQDAITVLEFAGARISLPDSPSSCCGALHSHAGNHEQAQTLARATMASMPGADPILVDSAGCGAAMKEYGHLLGTTEAEAFSARVFDVHEWLARPDRLRRLQLSPTGETVVVQDPCHLRNVQRVSGAVRTVLGAAYEIVETADDALCCGAGGAYSVLQPDIANEIRSRKVAALQRATQGDGSVPVASANPGCIIHLGAAGVRTEHPMTLVRRALDRQAMSAAT